MSKRIPIQSIRTVKIGDSSLITAQLCRDLYKDERSFCWAIHEELYKGRKPINHNYAIYEAARLVDHCRENRHFQVLAYNFDDYLKDYLNDQSVEYNVLYTENLPVDERVSIYHVQGYLPQVKNKTAMQQRHMRSIFLTEENYNDLYNHPYSW